MSRPSHQGPELSRGDDRSRWRRYEEWYATVTGQICTWVLVGAVFLAWATYLGGPNAGDSAETNYATWAVAHGAWSCLYPPAAHHVIFASDAQPFAVAGPLYPLLAGLVSWVARIGHAVTFPTAADLGPHCLHGYARLQTWSQRARVLNPTLRIGYLSWVVLAAGLAFVLRVARQCASLFEPLAALVVTLSPAVVHSLTNYFHPEDLLALGLTLLAAAELLRGRASSAGAILGLAVAAQPLALLATTVLGVVAVRTRRWQLLASVAATLALVALAVGALTQGRGLRPTLMGSNRIVPSSGVPTHSAGGTVLAAAHLSGLALFALARLAPLLTAAAVTWWVTGRNARASHDAPTVLSLLGLAFVARLVFEENIFSYYFAAVVVMLVAADFARGRWRTSSATWLVLCALAYPFLPLSYFTSTRHWPISPYLFAPGAFIIFATCAVVRAWPRRRNWYLLGAVIWTVATDFPGLWSRPPDTRIAPLWLIQLVLVAGAGVILGAPLWREGRPTPRPARRAAYAPPGPS